MRTDYKVRRISTGDKPAIHAYFDVSPESPDGQHVIYFQFNDIVPGPGKVILADKDGGNPREIGRAARGDPITAVWQQWIDNDHAVFSTVEQGAVRAMAADIRSGRIRRVSGAVRSYCPGTGLGLYAMNRRPADRPEEDEEAVHLLHVASGQSKRLFTREDVLAMHPPHEQLANPHQLRFSFTKWSPDGQRLFAVFGNDRLWKQIPKQDRLRSLILADADGSRLRYFRECGGFPMWGPDSRSVYMNVFGADGRKRSTLYKIDSDEAPAVLYAGDAHHNSLSPDGNLIVGDMYNWPEPGLGAIVLHETGSDAEGKTLAVFDLKDTSLESGYQPNPVWSADGKRIYFNAADPITQLCVVDLE